MITVIVDEISLSTAVAQVLSYDAESGETYPDGERTIADIVAEQILAGAVKETARYRALLDKVTEIRAEEIREAVRPQIEEAIAKPVQKTNSYGEPVGEPATLRDLVIEEARKALNAPSDRYSGNRESLITKTVREEVQKALKAEIAGVVAEVKKMVADQAGEMVAAAVAEGMRKR